MFSTKYISWSYILLVILPHERTNSPKLGSKDDTTMYDIFIYNTISTSISAPPFVNQTAIIIHTVRQSVSDFFGPQTYLYTSPKIDLALHCLFIGKFFNFDLIRVDTKRLKNF